MITISGFSYIRMYKTGGSNLGYSSPLGDVRGFFKSFFSRFGNNVFYWFWNKTIKAWNLVCFLIWYNLEGPVGCLFFNVIFFLGGLGWCATLILFSLGGQRSKKVGNPWSKVFTWKLQFQKTAKAKFSNSDFSEK